MANSLKVTVPDIGGFKDVSVIDVLVKDGQQIDKETPMITIETEKAAMDVPSPAAGRIVQVKLKKGDKVSEGSLILLLESGDEAQAPLRRRSRPKVRSRAAGRVRRPGGQDGGGAKAADEAKARGRRQASGRNQGGRRDRSHWRDPRHRRSQSPRRDEGQRRSASAGPRRSSVSRSGHPVRDHLPRGDEHR